MVQYVSPREAAATFIVWLVLGLAAVLVHEERIRIVVSSRRADIFTDKREVSSRADGWFIASCVILLLFYLSICVTLAKTGTYIINMETDVITQGWWAGWFLTALTAGSLWVPGVMYLRYWLKIKRLAKKSESQD